MIRFIVRVATPADETPISQLIEASYTALLPAGYDAPVLEVALPMMARANPALLSSGTYYLATRDGGAIVGCGGWTKERPGTQQIEPHLAHIRHFATHPDWLGHGIGRAIYLRCEEEARSAGARRLECYASLNAERFYAALGFEPVQPVEIPMGPHVKFPSLLMEKAI